MDWLISAVLIVGGGAVIWWALSLLAEWVAEGDDDGEGWWP